MEQVVPSSVCIGDLRIPYKGKNEAFTEDQLVSLNPMDQFKSWFEQIRKEGEIREPNAMCLSTVRSDGQPSSRFVLLKGFDNNGFKFFTNTHSRKGKDMEGNKKVALNFYWAPHHRQVRVEGHVELLSDSEADEYFHSRPFESQVGSAASDQSTVVPDRNHLISRASQLRERHISEQRVPKPPEWGGYLVVPHMIEFWQGQSDRLHDRIIFRKKTSGEVPDGVNTKDAKNGWVYERLAP